MMWNLLFAVANITSAHPSICKKNSVTNRDGQFYFIYFCNLQLNIQVPKTSSRKLYGYFSNDKTNSRLKLDRLFWQYSVNIKVKLFLLIIGKVSWNSFLVTHNIGLKHISQTTLWSFIWCLLIAKSRNLDSKMFAYIFLRYDILSFSIATRNLIFENT